jgi:hypothetical protein
MEKDKKIDSLSSIPDTDVQTLEEAKMLISAINQSNGKLKDELNATIKALAEAREQSNTNFKKLLSMTQPVGEVKQVEEEPNFEKIKI